MVHHTRHYRDMRYSKKSSTISYCDYHGRELEHVMTIYLALQPNLGTGNYFWIKMFMSKAYNKCFLRHGEKIICYRFNEMA